MYFILKGWIRLEKIKIVVKKPMQQPEILEVENTLEEKQRIVGGYIEYVPFGEYDMFLNEEGKLERLKPNLKFSNDVVVGTIYISKANDEGEAVSLSDEECNEIISILQKYTITSEKESQHYENMIKAMF